MRAHDRVRRLRRRHLRRASSASTITSPCRREHEPRQRALAHRREARGAGRRRDRAADGVRRQRPAGRHAGRRRAHLSQPLRASRRARRAVVFTDNDDGWRTVARSRRAPASRSRPWSIRAPARRRAPSAAAGAGARVICRRRGRRDARRRGRSTAVDVRDAAGRDRAHRLRPPRRVRRLEPDASTSPRHLGGKPAGTRRIAAFVPGALPPGMAVAGAAAGPASRSPTRLPTGRALGGEAAADCGFDGHAGARARRPTGADARRRRSGRSPVARGQGVRRLPERRDRDGRGARRTRGLPRRSSTSSATPRSAWRPTRARPRTSPASRIMAGAHRHDDPARSARRPSARPTRRSRSARSPGITAARISARRGCTPSHALGAGAGRGLRRDRRLAARAVLSARRRDATGSQTREPRGARRCARGVGVCDVSTLGKIDVQGPDAGRVPRPRLHQRLLDARRSARRATG